MMRFSQPSLLMVGIVLILVGSIPQHGSAQSPDIWTQPINLSKSGAAAQPRLVATPAGDLQVFWWDSFDGLMTIIGRVDNDSGDYNWSAPLQAPISSKNLVNTPSIYIDTDGWIHAFWVEKGGADATTSSDSQTTAPPATQLLHSEMAFGNSSWSFPDILAESIAGYSVITPVSGGITIAYIRNRHTPDAPAGVYVKSNDGANKAWGSSRIVYSSIYYRLILYPEAQISLADIRDVETENENLLYLAWYDPHQDTSFISQSEDEGFSWFQAQSIGDAEERPIEPRLIDTGNPGLIWQASAQGGCTLYQEEIKQEQRNEQQFIIWGNSKYILEDLTTCPQNDRFLYNQEKYVWLWNEGSSNLALTIWDESQGNWSQVSTISLAFENETSKRTFSLNELYVSLANQRIFIVGSDTTEGEIWLTYADFNSLAVNFKTPSLWRPIEQVSERESSASLPAIAVDDHNQIHLVWDQGSNLSNIARSLYYAVSTGETPSRSIEIFPASSGEITRLPSLLYYSANNSLQLVWSGGKDGSIFYSWSSAQDAGSPNSWSAPKLISGAGAADSPQIVQDSSGVLYTLYIVPLNEDRGVYLVQSNDLGKTWSNPITVFNAANSKWPMLGHPTLAVSSDGAIHVAWVQMQLPDLDSALGVFYSRSTDHGTTWSPILSLTGSGYDWPRLALSGGKVHLLFASSENGKGSLYHRWAEISNPTEISSSWSTPLSIPGWREIALPYGLTSTGAEGEFTENFTSTLHLIGTESNTNKLRYSTWEGRQWSVSEKISAYGQIGLGLGTSAASVARGEILAVGWLGVPYHPDYDQQTTLFFTSRDIPKVDLPPVEATTTNQTTTPTVTSMLILNPTLTPTSTPDLNAITSSEQSSFPLPPLTMGIILAAIMIAGIFTARLLYSRSRDRSN